MLEDDQTVKTRNRGKLGNQKYGKIWKTGVAPLGATWVFPILSFCLGSARKIGVPPRHKPCGTRRLLPPDHHGQSGTPAVSSIGGGGSEDRINPDRALCDPREPFPDGPRGWGGPIIREVIGPGDPLLPGVACVGGIPYLRPGAGNIGRGWPGRNGDSLALIIIRPGRPILNHPMYLFLPGRAARRGPPLRWWIFLTRPLRHGTPFMPCHKWTT